jgi:hypothetical protein
MKFVEVTPTDTKQTRTYYPHPYFTLSIDAFDGGGKIFKITDVKEEWMEGS